MILHCLTQCHKLTTKQQFFARNWLLPWNWGQKSDGRLQIWYSIQVREPPPTYWQKLVISTMGSNFFKINPTKIIGWPEAQFDMKCWCGFLLFIGKLAPFLSGSHFSISCGCATLNDELKAYLRWWLLKTVVSCDLFIIIIIIVIIILTIKFFRLPSQSVLMRSQHHLHVYH